MPKFVNNLLKSRKLLLLGSVLLVIATYYFSNIYKPSTAEFLEIKHQEQLLQLGKPWRYETSDRGHWMSSGGSGEPANINSYSRYINLLYKSDDAENVRIALINNLNANEWKSYPDPFAHYIDDPSSKVYKASRDFFTKSGSMGRMCAVVETQNNPNYRRAGPWLAEITLMGKTDGGCRIIK